MVVHIDFLLTDPFSYLPRSWEGYAEVSNTDGSKTGQGFGAEIYFLNKNKKWAFPLGQYGSIFQAEVYGIQRVATWIIFLGE